MSGGDLETYLITRPRQSKDSFENVVKNLRLLSKLRVENKGAGVYFALMCVVTKQNCDNLLEVAKLAQDVGATYL